MRIISGKWRGRKFYLPKGVNARPTSDMLREALFSILRNETADAVVLDLFAGSASFAFEALSRGAKHAIICDHDRKCMSEIKANLELFGAKRDDCTLINNDFRHALRNISHMDMGVDICYIDPPYKSDYYTDVLSHLDHIINPDGIVILEHSKYNDMPESIGMFTQKKQKKYGNNGGPKTVKTRSNLRIRHKKMLNSG